MVLIARLSSNSRHAFLGYSFCCSNDFIWSLLDYFNEYFNYGCSLNLRIVEFQESLVNYCFSSFHTLFVSTLLKQTVHIWSSEAEGELVAGLMLNILLLLALFFIGEYINIFYGNIIGSILGWIYLCLIFFQHTNWFYFGFLKFIFQ
jgi:hypothetical protein